MNDVLERPPQAAEPVVNDTQRTATEPEARQFVTFRVGDEVFAVPMAPVQEIIRLPDLIRVPLAPPALKGLANLRGTVLPVIALRDTFGIDEVEPNDATRVLVIDLGSPVGFIVDEVSSVITAAPEQIEAVERIESTINSQLLLGVVKQVGGHDLVMILDFQRLMDEQFQGLAAGAADNAASQVSLGQAGSPVGELQRSAADDGGDEMQLVSFVVAGQEYAIAIEHVQEIVQVPPDIVRVPNTPAHVLGVMTLRTRLLPLVSLRCMFDLPVEPLTDQNRIVVISLGTGSDQLAVGVVMDSVSEVLRVPQSQVDPIGRVLAQHNRLAEINAICRLADGRRLVSILSAQKMFENPGMKQALQVSDQEAVAHEAVVAEGRTGASADDDAQMVVFRLAQEEFGVPIDTVQEIVRVPDELARVPRAPSFIEGVINLRGAVLPVVDFRRRLGLANSQRNDRQRIMVFTLNGTRTGFIVDSVTEVLKIGHRHIEPAPTMSVDQARLIRRVANLEKAKRMILLMSVDQVLDADEQQALHAATAA